MVLPKRQLIIIAGGLMAVAAILFIVTTALPSWVKRSASAEGLTIEATGGLWQQCVSGFEPLNGCRSIGACDSDDIGCGKLNGGRAFMILTILASVTITILIFLNLNSQTSNPSMAQTTRFGALIVLPLGIVGLALGISAYSALEGSLGPAGILGIIAIVVNVVAGVVSALIR